MVPYLTRLSNALAASMIGDARPVTLKVVGTAGRLSSRQAESIGLITTELVMNALKHAFPSKNVKGPDQHRVRCCRNELETLGC